MDSLLNALIGEYRITALLGVGGMGEVYKAVHTHLGRVIAIKVLSPGFADSAAIQRFYSEASIQAALRHPGVAEYLGFHEYRGRPCILMEYVDGETLSTLLERRGPLAVSEAVRIMRDIAAIVAHCHAQGILHRDLKTNNVKINASGQIKILDFGIARHQRSGRLTGTGKLVGTPDTIAPEQVRGETASEASDVWQLGILFYELLTARRPFSGSTPQEVWYRILNAEYPPLSPAPPREVERILARSLQKEIAHRFRSAGELCSALHDLEHKASPARRPKLRIPAIAAAIVLALLLSGAGLLYLISSTGTPESAANTITVDSANGTAEVYRDGRRVGVTPFAVQSRTGEKVKLVLRREGYEDVDVQFESGERRIYTYHLEPARSR